jgi:hypothetical protein
VELSNSDLAEDFAHSNSVSHVHREFAAWRMVDLMERIEAVMKRSELKRFLRCVERLGIFGFDLSENRNPPARIGSSENGSRTTLTVDFAVRDVETNETIHAILEQARPDSIAIFKLCPESTP